MAAAPKMRTVSTHPSTLKMLMEALESSEEKKGMSVQAIKTFIMEKVSYTQRQSLTEFADLESSILVNLFV